MDVQWTTPDTDIGGTGLMPARLISHAQRDAFLAKNGWTMGKRLPHSACPIDPVHISGDSSPVAVLDKGLFCHSCQGRHGNGFTAYAKLIATGTTMAPKADIADSARNYVPFSHVKIVMASTIPLLSNTKEQDRKKIDEMARWAYSAIVKQVHRGISIMSDIYQRIFTDNPFCRGNGLWLRRDTLRPLGKEILADTAKEFSSARCVPDAAPLLSLPSQMKVELHRQDGDIPGFQIINPVFGSPVHFHHNRVTDSGVIRATPERRRDSMRYLSTEQRMSAADQEAMITSLYHGYNVNYSKLLICAKGCGERGFGDIPYVRVRGVSGSQKTGNVMVTGSAVGETINNLRAQKDDNYGEAIGASALSGSMIFGDEMMKGIGPWTMSRLRPLILSITRTYTFRGVYIGTRTIDFNSAFILADTDIPPGLHEDEQFIRRFIDVCLLDRVPDWKKTGIDWSSYWNHTADMRRAFESMYSDLIDTYFYDGATMSFQEIAGDLGFNTVEETLLKTENGQQVQQAVIDFFWAVIKPGGNELPTTANKGTGWKEIPIGDAAKDNPIAKALEVISVLMSISTSEALNHIKKHDGRWIELTGARHGARFEHRFMSSNTYVRFVHGETKGQKVNDDLVSTDQLRQRYPDLPP